ncbi:MAG: hypothetical protein ACTHWM_08430 [Yaniella sp.]|uniref:hypothetical protein n=1 Tax=Yaniella sp. TaxID=2773929 RepID=UPI003F969CE0
MTINGVLTLTMPVAAAQTPGDAVQSGQVTWFQDAFNNYLNPMLEANPQLGTILTWVAVILITFQVLTIFSNYKKDGFKGWMVALIFTTLLTTALIAPSVMLPFWLGLIDTIIGLVLSILGIV